MYFLIIHCRYYKPNSIKFFSIHIPCILVMFYLFIYFQKLNILCLYHNHRRNLAGVNGGNFPHKLNYTIS